MTFADWAKENPREAEIAAPARCYKDSLGSVPLYRRFQSAWTQTFAPGEDPVVLKGLVEVRARKYDTKAAYTDDVLERFMRRHKIVLSTSADTDALRKYVYGKPRGYWHNFNHAMRSMRTGVWDADTALVHVNGKRMLIDPAHYAMMQSIAAMRDKFINLP